MSNSFERYTATALILATAGAITLLSQQQKPAPLSHPLESVPGQLAGWTWKDSETLDSSVLEGLKPTSYLSRRYEKRGASLGLFIEYYAAQQSGESIHSPKHCLPGSGWEIWRQGSLVLPLREGAVTINKYSIRKDDHRLLMLYWYQTRHRVVRSEYLGKFLLLRDAIIEGHTQGSLVRILLPDEEGISEEGAAVAKELIPGLEWCFGD
jgi:EpsI family protein